MLGIKTGDALKDSVETGLAECLHRTGFYALTAFLAGFEQTGLIGLDQRMRSQLNLTHETSQPPGASDGCDQQVIDSEPAQIHQVGQMFVRPARHQLDFIKVVGGRCQP